MSHEAIILVIPEEEQDFITATLAWKLEIPQEHRKHIAGPVVSKGGNRTFIFLPAAGMGVDDCRKRFLDHGKSNPHSKLCHIKFGGGNTEIIFSSDPVIGVEDLIERYAKLTQEAIEAHTKILVLQKERDEAIANLDKDVLLVNAIKDLKLIGKRKKLLEVALAIAQQYKDQTDIPEPIQQLVKAFKE
jgi:hypothetical protein